MSAGAIEGKCLLEAEGVGKREGGKRKESRGRCGLEMYAAKKGVGVEGSIARGSCMGRQ